MAIAATAAMAETATRPRRPAAPASRRPAFPRNGRTRCAPTSIRRAATRCHPAALIFDRIGYSEIFQTGGDIAGHPLLWLPIEANLPGSATKWTPARYAQSVGPLLSVNLPGRRPMLFAAKKRGPPLFVGVDQVTLRKRFNVDEAVASEAAKLPARYAAKLKE